MSVFRVEEFSINDLLPLKNFRIYDTEFVDNIMYINAGLTTVFEVFMKQQSDKFLYFVKFAYSDGSSLISINDDEILYGIKINNRLITYNTNDNFVNHPYNPYNNYEKELHEYYKRFGSYKKAFDFLML